MSELYLNLETAVAALEGVLLEKYRGTKGMAHVVEARRTIERAEQALRDRLKLEIRLAEDRAYAEYRTSGVTR